MNENEIYDVATFDGLSEIIDDKVSELRAENDPKKQLEHLAVIEKAVQIRKGISVNEEPQAGEKGDWLNTPRTMTVKELLLETGKILATPLLLFAGTVVSTKMQTNTQKEIAEMQQQGRKDLLNQVAGIEETDVVSKHQIDVVNSLK